MMFKVILFLKVFFFVKLFVIIRENFEIFYRKGLLFFGYLVINIMFLKFLGKLIGRSVESYCLIVLIYFFRNGIDR